MKKLLTVVLALFVVLTMLGSCSKQNVNNSDDIKGMTIQDVLERSTEASLKTENVSADFKMNMGMFIKSEGIEMNLDMSADLGMKVSVKDMLYEIDGKMTAMGMTVPMKMYMDMNSPMTTYTSTPDGDWYKETVDEEEYKELYEFIQKSKELEAEIDYAEIMENLSMVETTYEEKPVYEITGEINYEKLFKELDFDLKKLLEETEEKLGVPEGFYDEIISSIGNLPYTMGVDKETFYPVYVKTDLTDNLSGQIEKILKLAQEESGEAMPEGTELELTACSFEVIYKDIGTTKVEIPEEVLAAPEQDEYYDSLYDDDYYYEDDYYGDENYYDEYYDYSDYDYSDYDYSDYDYEDYDFYYDDIAA